MAASALVLISGGIDSMACAHFLSNRSYEVSGLFLDYGQAAVQAETAAVTSVADSLRIQIRKVTVAHMPPYEPGEIRGRNGFLAMLALMVSAPGTAMIATGIHRGTPYYDCSAAFAERMDTLICEYTSGITRYFAPFLEWSKHDIFQYCLQEHLDLSLTYSCEAGTLPPCGTCASCVDRRPLDVR